jgi:hypothetical protein
MKQIISQPLTPAYGTIVNADVAYKYVPFIKTKVQSVKVVGFDGDVIVGVTGKGNRVYFTVSDIKN